MSNPLGPFQQRIVRRHTTRAINQYVQSGGDQAAFQLLNDPGQWDEYCQSIADGYMNQNAGAMAEDLTATPKHPALAKFFQWLRNGGLQWIFDLLSATLPLFGVKLPPITIPPIPGLPGTGSGGPLTAVPANFSAMGGEMKAEFAVPPWVFQLFGELAPVVWAKAKPWLLDEWNKLSQGSAVAAHPLLNA